ncbi:Response regulator receiver domain-containing protein [Candidatus Kryptonium thompsonii]|nr:Response regulator receiver domain-containing protein [Candidatus Kryptonium thompsoni]
MNINGEIKVLVVDDSAFMRKSITMMLESDPQIKVVATARDGLEAIEKIKTFKPDIVTLDVEMPRMDGLTTLKIIMNQAILSQLPFDRSRRRQLNRFSFQQALKQQCKNFSSLYDHLISN